VVIILLEIGRQLLEQVAVPQRINEEQHRRENGKVDDRAPKIPGCRCEMSSFREQTPHLILSRIDVPP
jgi:hypothetical protein